MLAWACQHLLTRLVVWFAPQYDVGDGFGHFGLALTDVYGAAKSIKEGGGMVRIRLTVLFEFKCLYCPLLWSRCGRW